MNEQIFRNNNHNSYPVSRSGFLEISSWIAEFKQVDKLANKLKEVNDKDVNKALVVYVSWVHELQSKPHPA